MLKFVRGFSTQRSKQVKLFTPGPLNTTDSVKAMLQYDYGTRTPFFVSVVADTKKRLLDLAGVDSSEYTAVLLQGSGTAGVEAALGASFPRVAGGKEMLIIANGAYGERQVKICDYYQIPHKVLRYEENQIPSLEEIDRTVTENPQISHVSVIHSETTAGLLNPAQEIGELLKPKNVTFMVDAMSSFGVNPIDFHKANISYLISSANKMIQSIPAFSFVIAKLSELQKTKGNARSLVLDLYEEYNFGLQNNNQFRFTAPAGAIVAFNQALKELEEEGGIHARAKRYKENQNVLKQGMAQLGFTWYVPDEIQGHVLTTFYNLEHPKFDFEFIYKHCEKEGYILYPGKIAQIPSFRIGNIGNLFPDDMRKCVALIEEALKLLGVR